MADVAQLGISVDSSQAKGAAVDLDRLSQSAKGAEAAERGLAGGAETASGAIERQRTATSTLNSIWQQITGIFRSGGSATAKVTEELEKQEKAIGLNRVQALEFTHIAKSMIDQIIAGQSPIRALALEAGRLQTAFTYNSSPAQTFQALGSIFTRLLPLILPVTTAVAALGVGFAAFTDQVNKGHDKALGFFDVLKGTGITAWKAFTSEFGKAPAWMDEIWDGLGRAVADGVNNLIRAFATLGVRIQEKFSTLGYDVKKDLTDNLLNPIIDVVNGVTNAIAAMANLVPVDIPHATVTASASDQAAQADAQKKIDEINRTDYLGQIYKNGTPTGDTATSRARQSPFERAIQSGQDDIATLKAQADALGQTGKQAAFLEEQTKLLNEAREHGKTLSPGQIEQINATAEAYAQQKDQLQQLTDLYDTGQSATEDFFSTLKSDLKQGEGLWQSFGDAVGTVLDDIANKALQMAADGIWDSIFGGIKDAAGSGGSSGNIFSSILGSIFHFASGTMSAPGGLSLVGENGPELVDLPAGAKVYNAQQSAQMMGGQGGGGDINISVDARGAQHGVGAEIAQSLRDFSRTELPRRQQQIGKNPYRVGYRMGTT